jgi:hypothetical protein
MQPMEEIDAIVAATYNINLEYGILLAVYPVAAERYYDEQSPLLINIRKEGLVV